MLHIVRSQRELTGSGGSCAEGVAGTCRGRCGCWPAAVFVNAVVSFTFVFLFLYLTGPRGLAAAQAGLVAGIGGVGLVAGNFTGGWFGDRYGHRRVLLPPRTLLGGAGARRPARAADRRCCTRSAAARPVRRRRGPRRQLRARRRLRARGRPTPGLRRIRCAANAGFTLGPPLGALIADRLSYDWLFVVDGLGTLFFAVYDRPVLPARGSAPPGRGPDRGRAAGSGAELRARPAVLVLLGAILVIDLVYRQQYSTLPVFLADHGPAPGFYGALIAINGGVILLPGDSPRRSRCADGAPLRSSAPAWCWSGPGFAALLLGAGVGRPPSP